MYTCIYIWISYVYTCLYINLYIYTCIYSPAGGASTLSMYMESATPPEPLLEMPASGVTELITCVARHRIWNLAGTSVFMKPRGDKLQQDLIVASILTKYSAGPSIRPSVPDHDQYDSTMTDMIQVCSNFDWTRAFWQNTRCDYILTEGVLL